MRFVGCLNRCQPIKNEDDVNVKAEDDETDDECCLGKFIHLTEIYLLQSSTALTNNIVNHIAFADTLKKHKTSSTSTIAIRRTSPRLANLTTQIKDTANISSSTTRKRKLYDMLEHAKPSVSNHASRSGRVRNSQTM